MVLRPILACVFFFFTGSQPTGGDESSRPVFPRRWAVPLPAWVSVPPTAPCGRPEGLDRGRRRRQRGGGGDGGCGVLLFWLFLTPWPVYAVVPFFRQSLLEGSIPYKASSSYMPWAGPGQLGAPLIGVLCAPMWAGLGHPGAHPGSRGGPVLCRAALRAPVWVVLGRPGARHSDWFPRCVRLIASSPALLTGPGQPLAPSYCSL